MLASKPTKMIQSLSPIFVFKVNGGAVSWKSSKQETVADSTTEAKYIAASEAAKEGVWIRKFLSDPGQRDCSQA